MAQPHRLAAWLGTGLLGVTLLTLPATSQEPETLTVKQIMDTLVTPNTNALWGAYEIATDEQWQALELAAQAVITAGEMLISGGSDPQDRANAANEDWQQFNRDMIAASQAAITAIQARNEEALFNAGNDLLYPPCESCHGRYMAQ